MSFKKIEEQMKEDVTQIFNDILKKCNYTLDIDARTRAGADISDCLEDEFVKYIAKNKHARITNAKGAPKEQPKNPYDFCFDYFLKIEDKIEFKDLIWADIKATKSSFKNSNPDLGTPDKMIKFIRAGHFYLLYVFFEYEADENGKVRFVSIDEDNQYVKCVFLKDISKTVRINPKPQFQVNINEPEEYRSLDEFLDLFNEKYSESIERNIKRQNEKKAKLKDTFDELREKISEYKKKFEKNN